jgi:hypothetical protein
MFAMHLHQVFLTTFQIRRMNVFIPFLIPACAKAPAGNSLFVKAPARRSAFAQEATAGKSR